MKLTNSLLNKTGLLLVLAVVFFGFNAAAQTFSEPSGTPPASSVSTLLNTGSNAQTMTGSLWANSINANAFSMGSYLWDLEGGLTTIHIQQLCISGTSCITSFPTPIAHATIPTNGSTCNGGWCAPHAFTAAKVCALNGYSHVAGTVPGGSGGKVCGWNGSGWTCDGSCTSNCQSKTLTQVYCDNNGTSRLQ